MKLKAATAIVPYTTPEGEQWGVKVEFGDGLDSRRLVRTLVQQMRLQTGRRVGKKHLYAMGIIRRLTPLVAIPYTRPKHLAHLDKVAAFHAALDAEPHTA